MEGRERKGRKGSREGREGKGGRGGEGLWLRRPSRLHGHFVPPPPPPPPPPHTPHPGPPHIGVVTICKGEKRSSCHDAVLKR